MTPSEKLVAALKGVDWHANVAAFSDVELDVARIADSAMTLAIWSRQIEQTDSGNKALPFIREMQVASHAVAALSALGLYKAAAASVRTAVECALYYIYFRDHFRELATLKREPTFYIDKSNIISYMKVHIPNFHARQETVGFISRLNNWYSEISAIVHGQQPGTWAPHMSIAETKIDKTALSELAITYSEAVYIVDAAFKVCVAPELWLGFATAAKKALIKGMSGAQKTELGLDAA